MTLAEDATLASVRASATAAGYAFPVLDSAGRTVGVMSKTDFLKTVQRRLILVDHNEISQAVEGADQVEIIEIIDHHRIGSLTTHQPILFRNEPVGSTSTIVADCFLTSGVEIPRPIAGLLLAGLISDTLNLTSPTSTARDADVLRQLEKIADVQANHFKERFFAAGSLLTLKAAPQAITSRELDLKEMMIWGNKVSAEQAEKAGEEAPNLVPATWHLVRQRVGYDPETIAKGVLAYDLAPDGSVVYSNGTAIFIIDGNGKTERVHVERMIEQVTVLP
jgi:inorganic pyrophosphatase/exopolyphosphatase